MKGTYNLPAPGDLELVRQLLNTWRVPSATRVAEDRLPALLADPAAWQQTFPSLPFATGDTAALLVQLRDDLRTMARGARSWPETLNGWLERYPPLARAEQSPAGAQVHHLAAPGAGAIGAILAIVIDAVIQDTWSRLKICPDCQWAFYDRTRSRTKIWCDMLAGEAGGRACGTIAKVRRFRARQSAAAG